MTINERIKELRRMSGLTLKEVADRLNVTEGTANRYESGKIKVIPYEAITGLADIFDVSPAYIMGWELQRNEIKDVGDLTAADLKLVKSFHAAPANVQEAVWLILERE